MNEISNELFFNPFLIWRSLFWSLINSGIRKISLVQKHQMGFHKSLGIIVYWFLKFIYSEKGTKFCEISTLLLTGTTMDKSKVEISQNFVAFSEYMNFIKCCFCSGIRVGYANHFRPIISQRIFRFSPHISRFFCFASKIGNPLIFASTIFRYLARDTILQDPSSLPLLWKMFWCCWPDKGLLISKCPFGVFNSSKKRTKRIRLHS